jgi:uncharacterized protein (TIGR00304 family)
MARINSSCPLPIYLEDETLIGSTLLLVGIFAIFIGFLMIIISVALGILQDSKTQDYSRSSYEKPPIEKVESKVKAGGVIMLGPIPIIFGSDQESAKTAAILAIILMLLSLLFFSVVILGDCHILS